MKKQELYGQSVGTLVGQAAGDWRSLKLVVAFEEADKRPLVGDFFVVQEEAGKTFVCRVEHEEYASYSSEKGERERSLVEAHIRKVRGLSTELTNEEKQALFYFQYLRQLLGSNTGNNGMNTAQTGSMAIDSTN
jgi:hypothetical protein